MTNIFWKTCKCVYLSNLKKSHFWNSHFQYALPHFQFSSFCQNWKYYLWTNLVLLYKIWCLYLYLFWRYKVLNIHLTVTHIHVHRVISKNQFFFFWTQRTSKHVNQTKIRHCKFWPKTILPLLNGSWAIEVKKEWNWLKSMFTRWNWHLMLLKSFKM